MNKYLVGGAVRDKLLGLESKDNDYVVVGSSPEEMLSLGFKQVGSNFPVFLHPGTGEEYALARRERKTGVGYNGFEVEFGTDVTLEEDLLRRDLTINAMAMLPSGSIFDPFGGQEDLRNGILRHVSNAFAEDPLRVLRVARFAARYNFKVHPSTIDLCNQLVSEGELEHLTPERVWKEVSRMFTEPYFEAGWKFLKRDLKSFGNKILNDLFGPVGVHSDHDDKEVNFGQAALSPVEVAFFYTNIPFVKSETFFYAPTKFIDDVQRLNQLVVLFDTTGDYQLGVKQFIDKNRSFLSNTDNQEFLRGFSTRFVDVNFKEFISDVIKAAIEIYSLNFESLLAGVAPEMIKNVVHSHKMSVIKKVFS